MKKKLSIIYSIIVVFFDSLFINKIKRTKKNTQNVVFIRTDAIGDFVLWLSSLKEWENNIHGSNKILVCNEIYHEFAKSLNFFNEIFPINVKKLKHNFIYRYKIINRLKNIILLIFVLVGSTILILTNESIVLGIL